MGCKLNYKCHNQDMKLGNLVEKVIFTITFSFVQYMENKYEKLNYFLKTIMAEDKKFEICFYTDGGKRKKKNIKKKKD